MALNGLFCADVPLRNYSLTQSSPSAFGDVYGELWSTNNKVVGAHLNPPKINTARAV